MDKNSLPTKLLEKAKNATCMEELIALAKENGVVLTHAEAQKLFDTLLAHRTGELTEEELNKVAGGWLF